MSAPARRSFPDSASTWGPATAWKEASGPAREPEPMAEDHLAAPTPLEEHRKLAVFAGEWTGEEMVYPSRWTAGGPATSHVVARIDLNGFYLIQDTRQL